MKVALVQMTSGPDISENVQQVWELLNNIEKPEELDLIVFPENALFFRINKKEIFEGIEQSHSLWDEFHKYAVENDLALVWGGVALKEDHGVSNALIIQTPENKFDIAYRKIHLFDVKLANGLEVKESDQFVAGDQPAVWQWRGWKWGLSICYDLRFPELYLNYAKQQVDAVFIPAAFMRFTGEAHWHHLLRARAIETQSFVLAPAQTGDHSEKMKSFGHSLIVDPWGQTLADGDTQATVVVCELDKAQIDKVRAQIPVGDHRKL